MMIRWIGQSGYVLTTATTEIIIDPYLSDVVNKVAGRARLVEAPINPAAIRCDAVICTHDHLDHLDTDAVAMMPKNMHFITTGEGKERLNGLGQTHVTVLSVGQSMTVGDIQITAVYANHTVDAFGLIVKAEGKTLYFSGDTLFADSIGRTDFKGGSFAVLKKSCHEKLFVLPEDTFVLPGHMGTTTIGHEKKFNPFL